MQESRAETGLTNRFDSNQPYSNPYHYSSSSSCSSVRNIPKRVCKIALKLEKEILKIER